MAEPVAQNRYIYVHNNPLLFVEPSGLCSVLNEHESWWGCTAAALGIDTGLLGSLSFSVGTSANASAIVGSDVTGGVNTQSFSDGSTEVFSIVGTGSGYDFGADVQINAAVYTGDGSASESWAGDFTSINVSLLGVTGSVFGGSNWFGTSIGFATEAGGFSVNDTTYTPIQDFGSEPCR